MKLLFIEPEEQAMEYPLIDDVTLRMVTALRRGKKPGYSYCGFHACICGAHSGTTDVILSNAWVTNTLCVHYLAYHRAEVPVRELDAVRSLPPGAESPTDRELMVPALRHPYTPRGLIAKVTPVSKESPRADVVHWAYTVSFRNHEPEGVYLSHAEVVLGIDRVYGDVRLLDIQQAIPSGEKRSVTHTAVFRLADFETRAAAPVSLSGSLGAYWQLYGKWQRGGEVFLDIEARATSDSMSM